MDDQLKACPFCSGVAVVRGRDKTPNENFLVDTGGYFVACESCHMTLGAAWFNDGVEQVSNHNYDTAEEAAVAWNTRAQAGEAVASPDFASGLLLTEDHNGFWLHHPNGRDYNGPFDSKEKATRVASQLNEIGDQNVTIPSWAWVRIESFLEAARQFRVLANPYADAIDESVSADEDEPSRVFDSSLRLADEAQRAASIHPPRAQGAGEYAPMVGAGKQVMFHAPAWPGYFDAKSAPECWTRMDGNNLDSLVTDARDAARYRWLRTPDNGRWLDVGSEDSDGYVHIVEGKELDEAIDAALSDQCKESSK